MMSQRSALILGVVVVLLACSILLHVQSITQFENTSPTLNQGSSLKAAGSPAPLVSPSNPQTSSLPEDTPALLPLPGQSAIPPGYQRPKLHYYKAPKDEYSAPYVFYYDIIDENPTLDEACSRATHNNANTCWEDPDSPTSIIARALRQKTPSSDKKDIVFYTHLNGPVQQYCAFLGTAALSGVKLNIEGYTKAEKEIAEEEGKPYKPVPKPPFKVYYLMNKLVSNIEIMRRQTDPWAVIAFVDGGDVLFMMENKQEALDSFLDWERRTGRHLLISAETYCALPLLKDRGCMHPNLNWTAPYPYANTGITVGRVFAMKWYLEGFVRFTRKMHKVPQMSPLSDQSIAGQVMAMSSHVRKVVGWDVEASFAMTMLYSQYPYPICLNQSADGRLVNAKTSTKPVMYHQNGIKGWVQEVLRSLLTLAIQKGRLWVGKDHLHPDISRQSLVFQKLWNAPAPHKHNNTCSKLWPWYLRPWDPAEKITLVPAYKRKWDPPTVCPPWPEKPGRTLYHDRLFSIVTFDWRWRLRYAPNTSLPERGVIPSEPFRVVFRLLEDMGSTKYVEDGDALGIFTVDGRSRISLKKELRYSEAESGVPAEPASHRFKSRVEPAADRPKPIRYGDPFIISTDDLFVQEKSGPPGGHFFAAEHLTFVPADTPTNEMTTLRVVLRQ